MDLVVSSLVPIAASAVTAVVISIGCSKPREDPKKRAIPPRGRPSGQTKSRIPVKPGTASASARTGRSIKNSKSGSKRSTSQHRSSSQKRPHGQKSTSHRSSSAKRPSQHSSKRSSSSQKPKPKTSSSAKPAVAAGGVLAKKTSSQRSKKSTNSTRSQSSKRSKDSKGRKDGKHSSRSSSSKRKADKKPKGDATKAAVAADASAQKAASAVLAKKAAVVPTVPRLEMKLEPADLRFKPEGELSHVTIYNTSDKRRAIKVKCSDNLIYRVNPVTAFINAGEAMRLDVLRNSGAAKTDKLVVLAAETTAEETDARAVIAKASVTDQMVLPLISVESN